MARSITLRERFIFHQFFNGLAFAGALAEWGIGCWFLGVSAPPAVHVIGIAALGMVNRVSARQFEREPATPFLGGRLGFVALATAFAALMSAIVLTGAAAGWLALGLLAFRAEAGMLPAAGVEALFGDEFRTAAVLIVGLTGITIAYGYARGYRRLAVMPVTVPLTGLSPALAGLRLVQVSDLHLGPLADRSAVREAIDRINALDPDLVCVTGDIVDSPATDLDAWIPELDRLSARHGVFTILGNHDLHAGDQRIVAALARWTSWRVLRDEIATVEIDGSRLHLIGLDDGPATQAGPVLMSLAQSIPPGEPAVLLSHRPSLFATAAAAGIDLTLAGHTHGGQVAVPGAPRLNPARVLVGRFDAGLFARGDALLNVNRGLGSSGQRVRVGVPCEITVVTLVPRVARAA